MSVLSAILLANISLALLAAIILWQGTRHASQLAAVREQFLQLSSTDPVTNLPNRATLHDRLSAALSVDGPEPALMVMDLDGFKVVNDTLGHETGDELLKAVAMRMSSCLHEKDLLARSDAVNRASQTAQSIDKAMAAPFRIREDVINIKANIGITRAKQDDSPATEILRRADVAMFAAKSEKQESIRIYSPEMDEALQLRRTINSELDLALMNNQLQLVYQPLVCARSGKVMSAEALMRWPSKQGQAGSPGVFIPIAEESGLISKLGAWALDQAMLEIKRQKTIPIAVNVSPVQFRVDGFASSVEAALERHGIAPSLLHIEITEGVLISHTGEAQRTMKRLREMGVQVLLDDFGTGYSSLSYLQQFEFDGLKIDRAFIQQLDIGPTGRQLLKSIIALGHSLNMKVVAEGVETEDQAAILQLLACDFLQGYALGRPDAADKLHGVKRPEELLGSLHRNGGWSAAN